MYYHNFILMYVITYITRSTKNYVFIYENHMYNYKPVMVSKFELPNLNDLSIYYSGLAWDILVCL